LKPGHPLGTISKGNVEEELPLKQGLKLKQPGASIFFSKVEEELPLKQGLKP